MIKMHLRCRHVEKTGKFEFRQMSGKELKAIMALPVGDEQAAAYEKHGDVVCELEPDAFKKSLVEYRQKLGEMKPDGSVKLGIGQLKLTLNKLQFARTLEYLETVEDCSPTNDNE